MNNNVYRLSGIQLFSRVTNLQFIKLGLVILFCNILIISCSKEEEDANSDSTASEWYQNKWKRDNVETYLDLTGNIPVFCTPSNPDWSDVTLTEIKWVNSKKKEGYFDMISKTSGRKSSFQIKKGTTTLVLSPIDAATQKAYDPANYATTDKWPCGGSSGTTLVRPPHGTVNFYRKTSNWLGFKTKGTYYMLLGKWALQSPPCYDSETYNTNISLKDVNTVTYYLLTDKYPNGKRIGDNITITIQKQGETKTVNY